MSRQEVIVHVLLIGSRAAVLVFLNTEGIGEDGGATAVGEAAQHALPRRVVEVLLLVGAADIPLGQVIQRAGRAAEGAAGHVAPLVVTAEIALPALAGAGGTQGVQPRQFVRLSVAVEVLVLRAAAVARTLPQLPQVDIDIRVGGGSKGARQNRLLQVNKINAYPNTSLIFILLIQFLASKNTSYKNEETNKSNNHVKGRSVIICGHCPCNYQAHYSRSDWYTQKPVPKSRRVHRHNNSFSCPKCIGSSASVMSLLNTCCRGL